MTTTNESIQRAFAAATGRRACVTCKGAAVLADRSPCRDCLPKGAVAHQPAMAVLTIGRMTAGGHVCTDLGAAVRIYCAERDATGEGASTFPEGSVYVNGRTLRISYNGRVWDGDKPFSESAPPADLAPTSTRAVAGEVGRSSTAPKHHTPYSLAREAWFESGYDLREARKLADEMAPHAELDRDDVERELIRIADYAHGDPGQGR